MYELTFFIISEQHVSQTCFIIPYLAENDLEFEKNGMLISSSNLMTVDCNIIGLGLIGLNAI